MKTRIITIEGIDGSGKTVQFELLASRLEALGFSVARRGYPVYESFFGEQIGKFLSGSGGVLATDVDQRSMALWFALDRFNDLKDYAGGESDFLLINRYVLSNAVYQSVRDTDCGKPDIVDWVFELEYDKLGLPRPDLNIFLAVEAGCAKANVGKKGFRDYVGSGSDVYERSKTLQQRASDKYRELAERFDDIAIVECSENGEMRPIEAISDGIVQLLDERGLLKKE
ncbi:MAG: hypothetical protein IKI64_09980 [Clostridia bacterium]|nr:hypothetical protein [Clostridia bacterium]